MPRTIKLNKKQKEYIEHVTKHHMELMGERLDKEFHMRMLDVIEELVDMYEREHLKEKNEDFTEEKLDYLIWLRNKLSDIGKGKEVR